MMTAATSFAPRPPAICATSRGAPYDVGRSNRGGTTARLTPWAATIGMQLRHVNAEEEEGLSERTVSKNSRDSAVIHLKLTAGRDELHPRARIKHILGAARAELRRGAGTVGNRRRPLVHGDVGANTPSI